ncbi:MAG TPA: hypothetical protein VFS44_03865 [Gemmatimonadaceae bacterium]|nr:hypothetical protein [Gemmatimonadaceae bacterium]
MTATRTPPASPAFGSAELRAGDARVVIIPALGGKIASLQLGGREWLWTSDVIPRQPPVDGASYVEMGDSGGYDECFPTIAPCTLPSNIACFGGLSLPDHGELWSQPSTFTLETRPEGMYAATGWFGRRMPYRFVRAIFVGSDRVEMRYAVTNDGASPLPFLWSAHPLLPLGKGTRLVLPEAARVRVWSQHGIDLGGTGRELRWPRVAVAGKLVDLSHPDAVARAYACKLFVDVPASGGAIAVEEDGARLELTLDPAQVPHVGIWLNRGGWSPFRRKGSYRNLALEPCIGAPDSLAEALGAWRDAAWLAPGATREWTLVWRGVPAVGTPATL